MARTDADLGLRLTLLDLLLRPVGDWWLRPVALGLAGAGLLAPSWLGSPVLWLVLAAGLAARVAVEWPIPDNHAYLLAYWCLAAAIALATREPARLLAFNGRVLVGLAFALAVFWKLASPDFVDGTFLRVTLVTDPRFEGLARLFGGMTPETLDAARAALAQHVDGPAAAPAHVPALPAALGRLADVATWTTLALEAAVAALFLWPPGRGLSRFRDAALLLFCATTYAVATVEGFAWLLLAMGAAQCERERTTTRALYVAVFALVLFYREWPLASWLADAAG